MSITRRWSASVADKAIIIEGPDGSGKTQLATDLCEEFSREYRRPPAEALSSTTGPADWLPEWWNGQLALNPSALARGVYDRCFYISDPIYQQAQANRPLLIEGKALARGLANLWTVEPIIVFCLPPFEVQLANVKQSGRERLDGVDDKDLEKINNAYWAYSELWFQALGGDVMRYDYTEANAWSNLLANLG